nr:hypothetical protein [Tanacetum cinerariifolium]
MANNLSLPTNFYGDGVGDGADNEVSSPLDNNLEYGVSVGEHGSLLTAMDPTRVASSSHARNVAATPSR